MTVRPIRTALAAGVVLSLFAAGCIRDESGQVATKGPVTESNLPPCPLEALDKATGPVKVELWHALNGKSKDAIETLAKEYNASQSKVIVQPKSQGTDYDEVLRKYSAALASRQLPAIVYIEDVNLRTMVDSGSVLPAESCQKEDGSSYPLLPAVKKYYTADGIFWPGYVNVSEPVLYFNANHFQKAGLDPTKPPETLDELEAAAKQLKAKGVSKKPLILKMDPWFVESWINGAGGSVVNNDNGRAGVPTRATIENPVSEEVYDWLDRMMAEGLLEPVSKTANQINQYLGVANQTSSMTIETSTAATTIAAFLGGEDIGQGAIDTGGAAPDLSQLKPEAALLPGVKEPGKARVSGGAFYMSNTPPPAVQAGAWGFMRFMQQKKSQVLWHLTGSYLPATEGVKDDPAIQTFWKDELAGKILKTATTELEAIDPERPGPSIGPYPKYAKALQDSLEALAFRGATPDAALAQAQKDIDAVLKQYAEDYDITTTTTEPSG